jgi:CheY-like chemotaxis protein
MHIVVLRRLRELKIIKPDPKLQDIPIAIITTSKEQRDIDLCASSSACTFITKPVEFEEWIEIMKSTAESWLR